MIIKYKFLDLFVGAGGLALGIEQAGFKNYGVIDKDSHSINTIKNNFNWPAYNHNIQEFNFKQIKHSIDLISGGPPCQPFSYGGKHFAFDDNRNLFPEAIRAIREIKPKSFIFENVNGLLRSSFYPYFEYIILQLALPDELIRKSEDWGRHFERLKKNKGNSFLYEVEYKIIEAADYGVPQRRKRLFIVGFRKDLNVNWEFPQPTHSYEALRYSQFITGDYWKKYSLQFNNKHFLHLKKNNTIITSASKQKLFPWKTVRDTIFDLPDPFKQIKEASKITNHVYIKGARIYKGHTGSCYDLPAKTIKAGVHGVPGGENMLVLPDGKVRYFTIRECARLQCFSDNIKFPGSWGQMIKQIGNAVPVSLSKKIATSIYKAMHKSNSK